MRLSARRRAGSGRFPTRKRRSRWNAACAERRTTSSPTRKRRQHILLMPASHRRGCGVFRVGFLGSLKPWHGIDVLLEAFTHALAHRPDLRLEIVGAGPEAERVVKAALPPDAFLSHGPLPHRTAIEVMSQWDVGVAPFLPQPRFYFSPLKVVEYMAAGICAIASDLGQIRTLLGSGKRGVLVEPGSAGALAGAILGLAADRQVAAELGARARAYALSSLTWQKNAERALSALTARKE